MAKLPNNAVMYPQGRHRSVDGPWKPTVEEAINGFIGMLNKEELGQFLVCQPFVAEECDEKIAPAKDGKGICYRSVETPTLKTTLAQRGVHL